MGYQGLLVKFFTEVVESGKMEEMLKNSTMPNIPMPAMDGDIFWKNLKVCNGWRLQRNTEFGNCRILDPNNVRRAWGSLESVTRLFEEFDF